MKHILLTANDHGMPRIAAALIANRQINILGKNIDQLALPLISPLLVAMGPFFSR